MVDDDFDGKYIAVLERQRKRNKGLNIGAEIGIISEWSKKELKLTFIILFNNYLANQE